MEPSIPSSTATTTPSRFRPDVLLRIRDSDGDDRLDAAETLIEFPRATGDAANWYEHSYHAVIPWA